jgi:hypothetical protein
MLFHEAVFPQQLKKNTLYELQNEFQESEGMHINMKCAPDVHVPAAEDDVSQELQLFSGAEADV